MPVQLATINANGPVSWAVTAGILPPGLTLGVDTGLIDGFPTVAGVFPFTVQATDANRLPDSSDDIIDTQDLTITIDPDQVLDVDPDVVGAETQYTAITNTQFTASGGPGPFTFTVKVGDVLPPGLVLSSTGLLSGVPLVGGVYVFDVEARTASPPFFGATTISMTINAITPIAITNPGALGVEQVGVPITPIVLAATGGVPPQSWTIAAGNLPTGLVMNSSGVISGTPSANGSFNFTVRAQDSPPSFDTDELALLIPVYTVINAGSQPAVPQAWTTEAFTYQPVVNDGLGTRTWTLQAGALPAGLGFNASTGEITGTPTTVEVQAFTLRATDDTTAEFVDIPITIDVAQRVSIPAQSPPGALIGDAYSYIFTADDGQGPFIWSIIVPDMPSGLSLNVNTGEISGSTTLEQLKTFTIQVLDTATGDTASLATSIESEAFVSFEDTLLSLNPSHFWPLTEAASDYVDVGVDGGLDMDVQSSDAVNWFRAPAIAARGALNYGIWKPNNVQPAVIHLGGPTVIGYNTGGMGCWFRLFEIEPASMSLLSFVCSNNSGLTYNLTAEPNGSLRFEILGSGRTYVLQTGASFITPGELYYAHIEQEADGTGAKMYVNGVDLGLTPSFSGSGVDIDSWVGDVLVGFTASHTRVGGLASAGFDGTYRAVTSAPYINRNVVFGAANVATLYANAQVTRDPSDYHEYIADLGYPDSSLVRWFNGFIGQNGQGMGGGLGPHEPRGTAFTTGDSQQNVADSDVVSGYDRYKQIYGSSNPVFFTVGAQTNWEPVAGKTAGSVIATVTVNAVPNGDRKIIWAHGTTANNSMELGVIGSVLGWQIFFRAFEASVETYRLLSGIIALGGSHFGQIGLVQPGDGGGPSIYWQGSDVSGTTPITTSPDIWVPNYGDSSGERWGGEQGSQSVDNWEPGELHDMLCFIKALTPAEVSGVSDAINGVFA